MKINTIFKRDANNIIMPYGEFVNKELEWLRNSNLKFEATEKVDGTNIRLELSMGFDWNEKNDIDGLTFTLNIKGKTDNANIPKNLSEFLNTKYTLEKVCKAFGYSKSHYELFHDNNDIALLKEEHPEFFVDGVLDIDKIPEKYTIYGEGYGQKIQGCGSNYLKDSVDFIGFDVKVKSSNRNEVWLLRDSKESIFNALDTKIVPIIGYLTIDEAIEMVKKGFEVTIPHDKEGFIAEGLVMRSPVGMKFRNGSECIFKIKYGDFNKYYAKYGTFGKVEQPINENYG